MTLPVQILNKDSFLGSSEAKLSERFSLDRSACYCSSVLCFNLRQAKHGRYHLFNGVTSSSCHAAPRFSALNSGVAPAVRKTIPQRMLAFSIEIYSIGLHLGNF